MRQSDCDTHSSPSKQLYVSDMRPMSTVQVTPSSRDSVFIELRTRHAPVPQDRSSSPQRPMMADFSIRLASVMGISASSAVYSHA